MVQGIDRDIDIIAPPLLKPPLLRPVLVIGRGPFTQFITRSPPYMKCEYIEQIRSGTCSSDESGKEGISRPL
jgi:hypothetical protein